MFSHQSFDVVSFNSEISTTKSEQNANIQTTNVVYSEESQQTVETRDVETQTTKEQTYTLQVDYEKLAAFLNRVTPSVEEALDEACSTNAFVDYEPQTDEDTSGTVELLKKNTTVEESGNKISDLSWNSTGGTVAASLSILYHETWCNHLSKIYLYSLIDEEIVSSIPTKQLDIDSCVTTLSYHPTEPSILAAGLFNGDILVWNLREENLITPLQISTRCDAISQIHWKARTVSDVSLLIATTKDGYILVYKLTANFTTVHPHKRFKIAKEHNPAEKSRPRSAGGKRERAVEPGLWITSFDFSFKDPVLFVLGTLCGGIYKCSLDSNVSIEGDETLFDPVIEEYERYEGRIMCIKFSPTRNMFITSGMNKEIRIYDFNKNVHQQSIFMENVIMELGWIVGNEDVFVTYANNRDISIYNVSDGRFITNVRLCASGLDNLNILCVKSKRNMIVLGDMRGSMEIWKAPMQLL